HLLDSMAGMHAGKPEPAVREIEQAAVGDQRDRPAGPEHVVRARPRRADEIDPGNQRALRVLDAEQDHLRHDVVEIAGAERAGKAYLRMRIVAGRNEIDVALAVDLPAREKEHIDAALPRAIEQLARAVGKE